MTSGCGCSMFFRVPPRGVWSARRCEMFARFEMSECEDRICAGASFNQRRARTRKASIRLSYARRDSLRTRNCSMSRLVC